MKLGNQRECVLDDRIDFELSPSDIKCLLCILEKKAMEAPNYWKQGFMRELKDYFQSRHDDWRKQRDAKDRSVKSAEEITEC